MPMRSHTLASVDGMVAVRMAQSVIADAQRAVRDKAIYKPQAPIRPQRKVKGKKPTGRSIGYIGGQWRPEPEPEQKICSDGMHTDRSHVSRRYREARPWLSAREVRIRASEDLREREAMPVGSATKHTYSVAPKQGARGEQARRAPSQRILDSRHVATMPREIRHIKRVALPPVEKVVKETALDTFGQDDKVRLVAGKAENLAFGKLAGWELDPDSVGTVVLGGKRWKGDCLVEMNGQRLWFKCDELEMVERSSKPRPTTAEELKAMNKRRAAERRKRGKAKRLAQSKWKAKMADDTGVNEDVLSTEEIMAFFTDIDDDGSGQLDRDEVKLLLEKLGKVVTEEVLSTAMHEMNADDRGQVDMVGFLTWWSRVGTKAREDMTRLSDKMVQLRNLFETLDADGSGSLDHDEIASMITTHLSMRLKPEELADALNQMDADGSGEVNFLEFYEWWTKDETQATFQNAIKRMEAVKEIFDTLDADNSDALSREEVHQLAESLNAQLTERDLDIAMQEMDEDGDGEISFLEFYTWWMKSGDSVLQIAKQREAARQKMWKPQSPISSTYSGRRRQKEVLNTSQKQGKFAALTDGQSSAGPRFRRCTVDQLFIDGGSGHIDSDDFNMGLTGSEEDDYEGDAFEDETPSKPGAPKSPPTSDDQQALVEQQRSEAQLLHDLMLACEQGKYTNHGTSELEIMLEARDADGAPLYDVNGSVHGVTPLMVAARAGHADQCLSLLANGADIHRVDDDSLTAYGWAKAAGMEEVLELLRDHGAKDCLAHDADMGDALAAAVMKSQQNTEDGKSDLPRIVNDEFLRAANDKDVQIHIIRAEMQKAFALSDEDKNVATTTTSTSKKADDASAGTTPQPTATSDKASAMVDTPRAVVASSTDQQFLDVIGNEEARLWWRTYIGEHTASYQAVQDATIAWMLKADSTITQAEASIVAATVCFGIDRDRDGEITCAEFGAFSQDLGKEYSVSKLRQYEVPRKDQLAEVNEEKIREYASYLGISPTKESQLLWIARRCMEAPLPRGWEEFRDDKGQSYFYNEAKSKTSWDHPLDSHVRALSSTLPNVDTSVPESNALTHRLLCTHGCVAISAFSSSSL